MGSKSNKNYWEKWNSGYSDVWKPAARREMSKKETSYITSKLSKENAYSILDIGIGNGRILKTLAEQSHTGSKIFGIDISDEMVKICKKLFKNEIKITDLVVCDLSKKNLPFKTKFDFVTMIRVTKYNPNWQAMLKKIYQALNPSGVFIFSMPNNHSISILSGDKFSDTNSPILYSNIPQLRSLLSTIGFINIEFVAFSKLPNFLYHLSENSLYVRSLLFVEGVLDRMFGKSFLGRELFVSCQKTP